MPELPDRNDSRIQISLEIMSVQEDNFDMSIDANKWSRERFVSLVPQLLQSSAVRRECRSQLDENGKKILKRVLKGETVDNNPSQVNIATDGGQQVNVAD